MPYTVILSPHLDDAVFSCWHALSQPDTTVLTVFGGSPPQGTHTLWDRLCGQADSMQMMAERKQENRNSLAVTTATIKNLDFLDKQYRHQPLTADTIATTITKYLPKGSSVLAPLALSRLWRHPDHVLVRDAAKILARQGVPVSFYADAPYMLAPSHAPRQTRLAHKATQLFGSPFTPVIHRLDQRQHQAKLQAMAAYKTQYKIINLISFGRLGQAGRRDYELVMSPKT